MEIAKLAHDRRLPVVNHSFKSGINLAASLHFLAAAPNAFIFEYCVSESLLRQGLTKQKFTIENGMVKVPQEPGLGVDLDEAVVGKYRVG